VRQAIVLSVAAVTVTVVGLAGTTPPVVAKPGTTSKGDVAKARFFAFNDFHGALDPPTGSAGQVNGTPAGGAEYLSTELTKLRADAASKGQKTLTVGAGDMVGASPLVSAAFHDEPTIEALNLMQLDVTSVGNHEFDEGVAELRRLQNGGCHPVDGCQDGDGFLGASFPYLAANVVDKVTRQPIFPPYAIRSVQGVKVGFIGMTLEGTPSIVNPAGITSVDFLDEAETANHYTEVLEGLGVHAIVILLHEGGAQAAPPSPIDPSGCANFSGALTGIVANLDPDIDLVVSGHTHRSYVCHLPNSDGQPILATSAATAGVLVTDITATLSKTTQDFLNLSAQNVIVENGIRLADGTWQKDASGNFVRNPALVDPNMKTLLDKYRTAIAPIANRVVGTITSDITNTANSAGESALGDVIADAQLAYTASSANAEIAFMNPGGIRASLIYAASSGGEAPGEVTYGETFTVQPFNNLVTTQTFTGAQIKDVLEQQWPGVHRATQIFLQVSSGFSYTYSNSAPFGSRVSNMALNGVPIDPAASYRVTTNDFLANGGDGFTNLRNGTNRVYAPGFDVDALVAYLGAHSPVAPGPQNRFSSLG
jgi:5'-nucleotidase